MKISFTKLTIILLILFIMGVFFVSLSKDSMYNTKNLVGKKLNNVQLKSFTDDKIISEIDLIKNKFTLINFWASWCTPCQKEHPFLLSLKGQKNLHLIGVNFKDNKNNAEAFLKKLGDPYHYLARDDNGKQSINFGIYGIPESILIDENLIIIKKFIGPLSKADLKFIKEKTNEY